jgi:hypothetical protein
MTGVGQGNDASAFDCVCHVYLYSFFKIVEEEVRRCVVKAGNRIGLGMLF